MTEEIIHHYKIVGMIIILISIIDLLVYELLKLYDIKSLVLIFIVIVIFQLFVGFNTLSYTKFIERTKDTEK